MVLPCSSVCLYCKAWGNMSVLASWYYLWPTALLSTQSLFVRCCREVIFIALFLISLVAGKSRLEWRYSKNWVNKKDWKSWECAEWYHVTTFPVTPQPVNGIFLWLILHLLSSPSCETELTLYEWPTVSTRQWPLPLLHFIPTFLCAQLGYTYTSSDIQASSLWPQPLIIASLTDLLPCRPF